MCRQGLPIELWITSVCVVAVNSLELRASNGGDMSIQSIYYRGHASLLIDRSTLQSKAITIKVLCRQCVYLRAYRVNGLDRKPRLAVQVEGPYWSASGSVGGADFEVEFHAGSKLSEIF